MSPAEIRALRGRLGESTATFAKRFARSSRTIEDWEQGRRQPDALALRALGRLATRASTAPRPTVRKVADYWRVFDAEGRMIATRRTKAEALRVRAEG